MRNYRLGMRALTAVAAAVLITASLAACNNVSDPIAAPDAAAASRPSAAKSWWSEKKAASMSMSPTEGTLAVGSSTTLHVTYVDGRGNVIPDDGVRMTFYGCTVMQDALQISATQQGCGNVAALEPVYPGLRDVIVYGRAPGLVKVWASDGMGTVVSAMITVQ